LSCKTEYCLFIDTGCWNVCGGAALCLFDALKLSMKNVCMWPSTGRTDENVERMQEFIYQDRHLTVHGM